MECCPFCPLAYRDKNMPFSSTALILGPLEIAGVIFWMKPRLEMVFHFDLWTPLSGNITVWSMPTCLGCHFVVVSRSWKHQPPTEAVKSDV